MIRLNRNPEAVKAVLCILLGKCLREEVALEVEMLIHEEVKLSDNEILERLNRIAKLLEERGARCIRATGEMKGEYNPNDIYYMNRGEGFTEKPYEKTIVFYQGKFFWASYGEIVENNYPAYI